MFQRLGEHLTEAHTKKLQTVQNFAYHIVSGSRKYEHVILLLKNFRWLPVASQLYYRSAIMTFKFITCCATEYLSAKFIKRYDVTKRPMRNSQKLRIPLFKTATG